jgi:hypothetical protein
MCHEALLDCPSRDAQTCRIRTKTRPEKLHVTTAIQVPVAAARPVRARPRAPGRARFWRWTSAWRLVSGHCVTVRLQGVRRSWTAFFGNLKAPATGSGSPPSPATPAGGACPVMVPSTTVTEAAARGRLIAHRRRRGQRHTRCVRTRAKRTCMAWARQGMLVADWDI